MKNIKIIKTGIDVTKVKEQLEQYSDDWYIQRKGTDTLLERGYADMEVGNLQLIMGAIKKKEDFVGDSELCKPTPAYYRHTEIINTIKEEAVNFIEKRFGYKFKGSYINGNRTVSIVEAPNRKSLEKMVKIGVPIFTVMTKARFEDLHIKESSIVCKENLNTLIENSLEILEA